MEIICKNKKSIYCSVLAVFSVIIMCMAITGLWPNSDNPYNSYSLQAEAWLEGRLDLGKDYPWLELAIFDGKYYVSFPPFPSYVIVLLKIFSPSICMDHWIVIACSLISTLFAGKIYYTNRNNKFEGITIVLFLILGNGLLSIGFQGWVWYMAQSMCFMLSLMSLYYAMNGKISLSLAFWSCAVGCRPMALVYFPYLVLLNYENEKGKNRSIVEYILKKGYCFIVPTIMFFSYMVLNYFRFGDVFEFGHSYLPEFTRAENGQFSIEYFMNNLNELFRFPQIDIESKRVKLYSFGGQAAWMLNSLLFLAPISSLNRVICKKKGLVSLIVVLLSTSIYLFIVLCHRTLGGWQFGNRYVLDVLPYLYCEMIAGDDDKKECLNVFFYPLCYTGIAINIIGTVALYCKWI